VNGSRTMLPGRRSLFTTWHWLENSKGNSPSKKGKGLKGWGWVWGPRKEGRAGPGFGCGTRKGEPYAFLGEKEVPEG